MPHDNIKHDESNILKERAYSAYCTIGSIIMAVTISTEEVMLLPLSICLFVCQQD